MCFSIALGDRSGNVTLQLLQKEDMTYYKDNAVSFVCTWRKLYVIEEVEINIAENNFKMKIYLIFTYLVYFE